MTQDPTTPSAADAEFAAAWGDDAAAPKKPSKMAQDAADEAAREEAEFTAAFAEGEDK